MTQVADLIEGVPLSPQQRRLWSLAPGVSGIPYRTQCVVSIEGQLDCGALSGALERAVKRHEILRTSFELPPAMKVPLQTIHPPGAVVLRREDWTSVSSDEQASRFAAKLEAARQGEGTTALQASLVAVAHGRHLLWLELPALCADAAGAGNLWREIVAGYSAATGGEEDEEPPIQYADLAEWLDESRRSEEAREGREYWRPKFLSGLADANLACRKTRSRSESFQVGIAVSVCPPDMATRIEAAAGQASLRGFLLSCWLVLLRQLMDRQDLLISVGLDGRSYAELQDAIGPLVRHVPFSHRSADEVLFIDLLEEVEELLREAQEWQECFFWEENELADGSSAEGAFLPLGFELVEREPGQRTGGVRFSLHTAYSCVDRFEIKLCAVRSDAGLSLELHYDAELFEASDAERVGEQLQTLVESACRCPRAAVSELEMIGQMERKELEAEVEDMLEAECDDRSLIEVFEHWARHEPTAPAVVFEQEQLTYGELNTRANRLAHRLRRFGVVSETCVAICLERAPEMIVALFGVLKAGGAYVPLDPTAPRQRLSFMLRDSGARILLGPASGVEGSDCQVVPFPLNAGDQAFGDESTENPPSKGQPKNLVYMIYTSGSTGHPKGVAVGRRHLLGYVRGLMARLRLQQASFAMVSTFAADLGNTAIFGALCSGGTLHILSEDRVSDPEAFGDYMRQHRIDGLKIVPSHLEALLTGARPAEILPRRCLILGGEALPWRLIERVRELAPGCRWLNHYGPTETTVGVLTHEVGAGDNPIRESSGSVPLGRPLTSAAAHVLNRSLRRSPTWAVDELYIGGGSVTRGYHGQPRLTAEKFLANPFALTPGGRLYRTGDRVRLLPGGVLEFVGRFDHQVKIHGFRIELGEVEAALRSHRGVRDAVTVVREDRPGEKRLVAYFVAGETLPVAELQDFLNRRLPGFMVPAVLVELPRLPLSPNGKVDRKSLPVPELKGRFVGPRTEVERHLAEIWQQVLGVEQVGIHDNYFELGGDSILSIQIIARVHQVGLELAPRDLFNLPTIAELAAVTRSAQSQEELQSSMGEVTGPVPLLPIQHWFFEGDFEDHHHFNQSVLLKLEQALEPSLLETALGSLLSHHDALRLRFERDDQGWKQINMAAGGRVPFYQVDLAGLSDEGRSKALEAVSTVHQSSLDLARPPLLRAVLFGFGADRASRLLIVLHHLVVDGVSWRILLEDLESACQQLRAGEEVVLPFKTTSFQRWAEELESWSVSPSEAELWQGVAGSPAPDLPVDARGTNTAGSVKTVTRALGPEETRALLREVPKAYRTRIDELLLTALVQSFAAEESMSRLRIELEGHGREEEIATGLGLSRTVGWFTTRYPVLLELSEPGDPARSLKQIKEQMRRLPSRGLGYGVLRYLGSDASRLRACPEAEISFNYLGRFDQMFAPDALFRLAPEPHGDERGPRRQRRQLLDVIGRVTADRLELTWAYSDNVHRRHRIASWSERMMERLRALIDHCLSPQAGGATPSDFPLANLDQQALDQLFGRDNGIEDVYPLSPLQQGMLFHCVRAPDSGSYVSYSKSALRGRLDVAAFRRAWQEVIDQHPILRTSFLWQGVEKPLQVVRQEVSLPWRELDFSAARPDEQKKRLAVLLQENLRRGFDLDRAPLLHVTLIKLGADAHQVVWCRHHLLLDGWSTALLLREVMKRYQALTQGAVAEVAASRPYRDYIAWLAQRDAVPAEGYWRRALQGFAKPTSLSFAATSEELTTGEQEYDQSLHLLSREATEALEGFARQRELTLSTLVQGAWALMLGYASGESDIVFGSVVAGRPPGLQGAESMVGMFINTLPVRLRIPPERRLLPWLRELQTQQVEQREHEHTPLVMVQGWSDVPRHLPLFESLLVLENYPWVGSSFEGIGELSFHDFDHYIRNSFPLTLRVMPDRELRLYLLYECRRFGRQAMRRVLEGLARLLDRFPLLADEPLAEIFEHLAEADRQERVSEEKKYEDAVALKFKGIKRRVVGNV